MSQYARHDNATQATGPDDDRPAGDATTAASDGPAEVHSQQQAIHREIQSELKASDLDMIRVVEDLISVLIDKGVIRMTDLPKQAQDKIASRGNMRSRLSDLGGIVGDNEEILLP